MNRFESILLSYSLIMTDVLDWAHEEPAMLALAGGLFVLVLLLPVVWRGGNRSLGNILQKRFDLWLESDPSRSTGKQFNLMISSVNDWLTARLSAGRLKRTVTIWREAWFGASPLSLLAAIAGAAALSAVVSVLLDLTLLLAAFCSGSVFLGLGTVTILRARHREQLFREQFPSFLGKLSDALDVGFSLTQAVDFILPNLPQPVRSEMAQVSLQIQLGYLQAEAWDQLAIRRPTEDVRFFVEGLILQRQVGGNLPLMMRELAAFINQRAELAKEIKTMTAQGRLSALVISGLVPVSLGLLAFLPGYVDVLFHTSMGNFVLIAAGTLQLCGAGMVSRLIRIKV